MSNPDKSKDHGISRTSQQTSDSSDCNERFLIYVEIGRHSNPYGSHVVK